jgi:hypothetical protein
MPPLTTDFSYGALMWYKKSRHFQLTEKEYNKERKEDVQKWHRDRGSTGRNIRCRQ